MIIILILLAIFNKYKLSTSTICIGSMFSLFTCIGEYYHNQRGIELVLVFFILSVLYSRAISFIYHGIKLKEIEYKLNYLQTFLIVFCGGLFYVLIFFPGTIHYDAGIQLDAYLGNIWWDNQYPALSTYILGNFYDIGSVISDNFGIFFFCFTQYIISSLLLSFSIVYLKRLNVNGLIIYISLIFFTIMPIWPMNAYTFFKDCMYYLAFLIFVIKYNELYKFKFKPKDYLVLLFSIFMMLITRSEGLYIILISLIILLIFSKLNRIINIISIILIIIFNLYFHNIFLVNNNISPASEREKLSLLIQQTSRYLIENDISAEDRMIIENTFEVSVEEIKQLYNPHTADNVKFKMNYSLDEEVLNYYYKLWFRWMIDDPIVYIEAFLNNYYGYLYPNIKEYKDGYVWYYQDFGGKDSIVGESISMNNTFTDIREIVVKINDYIRNFVLIKYLYNPATYVWLLILFIGYNIELKRYRNLLYYVPFILSTLILFISPVNAYIRYVLPLMVSVFLQLGYTKKK